MSNKKYKTPKSVWIQILLISLLIIFYCWLAIYLSYNPFDKETYRALDIISTILQLSGTIVVAFEMLRYTLNNEQIEDYGTQVDELSDDLTIKAVPGKDKIAKRKKSYLDQVYRPVRNFEITVRRMYLFGLWLLVAGYSLQGVIVSLGSK